MTQRTFEDYVRLDPRIGELLTEARASKVNSRFYAKGAWYRVGGLRSRLKMLVGYGRPGGPNELRTSSAYEVVYRAVYRALLGEE